MGNLAGVYGVLAGPEPANGVWLIHKHRSTGELLGPSVPFEIETEVVRAIQTPEGWRQVWSPA